MSKSKRSKKWMILCGSFGGLLVVFLILIFSLGSAVKTGMTEIGPKITGTNLEVGSVTLSPFSGKLGISSMELGNPEGFETEFAVRMDDFRIKLQTGSVFSDVIKIDEVIILEPELSYENTKAGNNLKTIQANVNRYVPESSGEKKESKPKKVMIGRVLVKGAKLHWKPSFKSGDPITLDLPDVELKNIGTESGGVLPSEAVSKIMSKVMASSTVAVSGAAKELGKGVKEGAESIGKKLKSLF